MKKYSCQQALHALAAYCSKSERCISDVTQKLNDWEIPDEEQKYILKQLQKERFLDESRFCRAFVNDKSKYAKWGLYKIKYELRKRSVAEALISEALQTIDPEEKKMQLIQLLEAKKKTVKGKTSVEIAQKLMRFAFSRGFSQEMIESALEVVQKERG
ncbi:MAG: RecX family transcriptional regulator [Dysgonamonadaceae bacterium]|jgi:regulatory protein|nr:RecX family transcriptional regulator [Dysgonamonadaceae bacterium]